jgi:co-chaperonin GroES (HSP10)
MKGLNHFIVSIPEKYNQTFITEGGLELYGDKRWSLKQLANTVVEVLEVPLNYKGEIKKGSQLFVDATLLMQQTYVKTGEQENINLVDRNNKLYKVDPALIIAYAVEKSANWIGFGENVLGKKIKVKGSKEEKSGLIIMKEAVKDSTVEGKVKVYAINEELSNQGVKESDVVYVRKNLMVDVWLSNIKYAWIRNRDIVGVEVFFE